MRADLSDLMLRRANRFPAQVYQYDERDGLPTEHISSLGIDAAGNVFVSDGVRKISRLTNGKFQTVEPLGLTCRSWGNNLLDFQNIEFTFDAPHFKEEFALGANLRREVFLIFKESVNNIVKHAECATVTIKLSVENSEIILSLSDDGAGFETGDANDGHGLVSMKQRAAGLGGKLAIVSGKTTGTIITLTAPCGANANEKNCKIILPDCLRG